MEYELLSPDAMLAHQDGLVDLLFDVVNQGASVSFVAPITRDQSTVFWEQVVEKVKQGNLIVWGAFDDGRLVGSIQLDLAWQPNAPHRAEVVKVLVHSAYRRRGIASAMMRILEGYAEIIGRWLLFLDTEAGSGAQVLYETLGYSCMGVMPCHAINHAGEFADTVFFYKVLPHETV